jgi:hypothetical protein
VEGEPEPGMFFETLEERAVAILEGLVQDVFEIADRLMVVDRKEKTEFLHAGSIVRFLPGRRYNIGSPG